VLFLVIPLSFCIYYTKFTFVCNGLRSLCDWAPITLGFSLPMTKGTEVNRVYLSDDVLFQYSKLYESFKTYKGGKSGKIYHVGNLNPIKTEILNNIALMVPEILFILRVGYKLDMIKQLTAPNIEIRTPGLYNTQMYEEMSENSAYLFIGNGDADLAYYNKTLYDCSIGRTPFIYHKVNDCYGALNEISEFGFDDAESLRKVFNYVKENREESLQKQRDFLLSKQSTETLIIK
jgi:hypothetical protein